MALYKDDKPGFIQSNIDTNEQNIALLGFKMAVNEGLTVFNLVDGIVDEFHDESGTDEGEGSNDTYCASSDFYKNTTPTPAAISAGFGTHSVTEGDTSTVSSQNYPHPKGAHNECGSFGSFTVPTGMTSVNIQAWGAGGGAGAAGKGGAGGGYAEGTLAVTASQVLYVNAGEGGMGSIGEGPFPTPDGNVSGDDLSGFFRGGVAQRGQSSYFYHFGSGGGLNGVYTTNLATAPTSFSAPQAYLVAGSGGGGGGSPPSPSTSGGAGGGLTADAGGQSTEQTNANSPDHGGGGGDQEQGGQANPGSEGAQNGALFTGGSNIEAADEDMGGGGGAGFYGGGAGGKTAPGGPGDPVGGGGGGSSYYGHPQVTSGSTEEGDKGGGGGTNQPNYVASTNEGSADGDSPGAIGSTKVGEDGYVLLTGTKTTDVTATTAIVSNAFTAASAPTSSRIVVFQENIESITLNTDLIASISRDGGTTFTTVTLADSGYVTGSSGQRILVGTANISGQPSGTSMRWKLALANNQSKVHGVSLQWK